MKVILNTYPSAFITPGGGEIQLLNTLKNLKLIGVEASLFNQWDPRLEEYDVVHYFSVFGGSLYFCQMVKSKGRKLAVSPVLWPDCPEKYPMAEIQAILELADVILPNSQLEADLLSGTFGIVPDKFHVVYNAVEPNDFDSPADPRLFGETFGVSGYILCVANIEPRKNQLRLIQAVQHIDMPLICIGHIRDKEYYNACLNIAAPGKVLFVGPLPHNSPMLLSAYAGAELFILPSILETPGLAALEAAAAGCAKIIVTGVGSAREYFNDMAVYLEKPQSVTEITGAIMKQLSLPLQLRLREAVLNRFTWRATAEQTLSAYRRAVSSG